MPECEGGEEVIQALGAMLAGLLTTGRETGLWGPLPLNDGRRFAVQDDDDEFIWFQ